MLATAILLQLSVCLELVKRSDASWLAVPGAANPLVPFELTDDEPADEYLVTIEYRYSENAKDHHSSGKVSVPGVRAVNDLLRSKVLHVDSLHPQDIHVTLTVEKEGEDPLAVHKVVVEHELKVAHSIPIERLVNRTRENDVFPLAIARVAPPFAQLPLRATNYTVVDEASKQTQEITFEMKGDLLEVDVKQLTRPLSVALRLHDPSSGLNSDVIELHIAVPSAIRRATPRRNAIILLVSLATTALILLAVIFEARRRAAREKAEVLVVAREAVPPTVVIRG